jgi:hypothetical protein
MTPNDAWPDIASSVFASPDGKALLSHLDSRFGLCERVFIPAQTGSICPYRAAIRDGERAAIAYLHSLINSATNGQTAKKRTYKRTQAKG